MSLKFLFNTVNTCLIDSFFFLHVLIYYLDNKELCNPVLYSHFSRLDVSLGARLSDRRRVSSPLCPLSVESLARNGAVSSLHENMTDKQRDRKGITSSACHHCNVRRQGTNIHLECVATTQRMMG